MTARLLALGIALAAVVVPVTARTVETYTPKAGSATRTAICDAMRLFVRYAEQLTPAQSQFLWKVELMRVQGNYAGFQGYPVDKAGNIPPGLPDMVYTTILHRPGADKPWEVVFDLTRTDVPDEAEMRNIRQRFPQEIPSAVIPTYWREKLGR